MLYIFDMGGVVTNTAKPEPQIAQALGVTVEAFRAAQFQDGKSLYSLLSCGVISEMEFWHMVGKNLGIKIETPWWEFFFHPQMNQDVKKIILSLRGKKGNRVVCGTNTIWAHYYNHLARGDYAIFDQTYASQQMGVQKPDGLFWERIMLSEGFVPGETFFTDDRKENIAAAAALGIKTHLFTDAKALKKAL